MPRELSTALLAGIDGIKTTGETPLRLEDTVFKDIKFPVESTKKLPGKEPVDTLYRGGIVSAFPETADAGISFNCQINHEFKLATDLDSHVHIVIPTAGAGAGAENVKFDLTYSWANITGEFPTETTVSKTFDLQDSPADTHILIDIGMVLASNAGGFAGVPGAFTVSSMLICSLTRDVSVADNYNDDIYLLETDFHGEVDSLGSDEEYIKTAE